MSILAKLRQGLETHSAAESVELARELAGELPEDCVLALHGDLGSGKTTFVGGLALAWGIREPVTSPTYNLFTLYRGRRLLAHLDAYRLSGPDDMEALMLDEFLRSPYCLAVEWPSRISEWLPPDTLHLELNAGHGGPHTIRLRA